MIVKNSEKLEKSEVALTVEVGAEEFEKAIEKAYRKKRSEIRVPGFRPGKAPRNLIEKMYGEEVFFADAVDNAWVGAYMAAVEAENLHFVGDPKIELVGDVTKEGFTFKAIVPVYPEVTLGQYKGLSAPKGEVKVSAEDVEKQVKNMAERNARLVPVEREAQDGDIAVIDFEGFLDGVAFEGGKGENYSLGLGSHTFIPGFEEQVVGMKLGEEKDIDVTFPEDYNAENLAGKAVVFHVKLNELKAKELPELDDDFAKDVSEFDTLAELKADLEAKMVKEQEKAVKDEFESALIEQVCDNMTAEIPEVMVDTQAYNMMENFKGQLQAQGIPYEMYLQMLGMDEEQMKADMQNRALARVKMNLALGEIIKVEGIEASEEEIEAEIQKIAERYKMDVDAVKKSVEMEAVADQVKSDKAVDLIVDSAVATAKVEAPAEETAE